MLPPPIALLPPMPPLLLMVLPNLTAAADPRPAPRLAPSAPAPPRDIAITVVVIVAVAIFANRSVRPPVRSIEIGARQSRPKNVSLALVIDSPRRPGWEMKETLALIGWMPDSRTTEENDGPTCLFFKSVGTLPHQPLQPRTPSA